MDEIEINKNKGRQSFWIVLAIYVSIFLNSFVFFTDPFEFYIGYLVYIVLLPVFIPRFGFDRNLLFIFLILLVTGIINILLENNTILLFFKVFTGLTLSYFFYFYVILEFKYDLEQLFKWYLYGCYIVSVIALIQFISFQINFFPGYNYYWIFNKWGIAKGGIFGIRINSIFAEPTHLASVLSAAFFICISNLLRKETYYLSRTKSVVIILAYLLSFSGLAQGGIFLTIVFLALSYGLIRYIFIVIPVAFILFNVLYNNVKDFKDRYEGLVGLFSGEEFKIGKIHGSSFILYNNFHVATENFKSNFMFGSGIGSHPVAFEKYSFAKDFKVFGFNSNGADANSMFLRLLSETGIFGIGLILTIVFKCYVRRNKHYDTYHWLISNSILIMIILNLFRQGHYFLNGFPFFVVMYYFNFLSYRAYLETGKTLYDQVLEDEKAALGEDGK